MKMLASVKQTPLLDIEFQDLSYAVKVGFRADEKIILNSINGKFYSGELTAILGPSGSGKTTLLNILAGYVSKAVTGTIKINNKVREMNTFRKLAAYITQEVVLQPLLTVQESMMVAAKLKLGSDVSPVDKLNIVDEVLTVLGLKKSCDTMSEQLSGGERKRLSIALELVNNPPVIFLDEPTSGLDTVAMSQCLETLKVLTGEGRTIICSIHQPSASSFMRFDQVYFMANGLCIYNGSPVNTLSYLSNMGLPCPTTYSPAEYIIEVVQLNQEHIPAFVKRIQNGKSLNWCEKRLQSIEEFGRKDSVQCVYQETTEIGSKLNFVTPFFTQFTVLLQRMMLQQMRDRCCILIQIFHHMICTLVYGGLFYRIGNNGAHTYSNFSFGACVMVFFVFTHVMLPILLFPAEVKLLKNEYSNRWYGLKAYYLALTLRNLPIMFILGLFFMGTTYLLSNQPMELYRFALFALGGLSVAIASEAVGTTVGAIFRITNGAIVGPGLLAPMIILAMYGIGYTYEDILLPVRIAMSLSYLRFGVGAMVVALLGDRPPLECAEILCVFKDPRSFMPIIGLDNTTYSSRILPLIGFIIVFRIAGYLALRYRLNSEVSHRYTRYLYSLFQNR